MESQGVGIDLLVVVTGLHVFVFVFVCVFVFMGLCGTMISNMQILGGWWLSSLIKNPEGLLV